MQLRKQVDTLSPIARLIVAILLPAVGFVLAHAIAHDVSEVRVDFFTYNHAPYDFSKTWWVWIIYLLLVGYGEYILWEKSSESETQEGTKTLKQR